MRNYAYANATVALQALRTRPPSPAKVILKVVLKAPLGPHHRSDPKSDNAHANAISPGSLDLNQDQSNRMSTAG